MRTFNFDIMLQKPPRCLKNPKINLSVTVRYRQIGCYEISSQSENLIKNYLKGNMQILINEKYFYCFSIIAIFFLKSKFEVQMQHTLVLITIS